MGNDHLEYVFVPLGLLVFFLYHAWLLFTILREPHRTVIGLNAESRHQWVQAMMSALSLIDWFILGTRLVDPFKNGVLAIQTIRNNIMASTLLATTAITLSSLIGIFASNAWNSDDTSSVFHSTSAIKRISITICFLVAFLCNIQSIRCYCHVSFLITAPTVRDKKAYMEYIAKTLNRGSHSWSLGLRAFYLSFTFILFFHYPMFPSFMFFIKETSKTRHLRSNSKGYQDNR